MLTIGARFPAFQVKGVVSTDLKTAFIDVSEQSDSGKWKIFFFYPKDFTFICPTEIVNFHNLNKDFQSRNAQLYGVSTDSEFVHLAWRREHQDLRDLGFPLLADIKRDLSSSLGILDKEEGVCLRATFIVDPQGIIRHVSVNDLSVGRNPEEILRLLDGLQSGELCGCNWKKGDSFVKVA
ncbi:MAG: peroxiredoxin [Alphaproteobacteria bacterium]|nr:peroxiredoxin [Alphaproteobacteria bacterium]